MLKFRLLQAFQGLGASGVLKARGFLAVKVQGSFRGFRV